MGLFWFNKGKGEEHVNARSLLSRLTLSATPQSYSCLPVTLEQHISPHHVLSNTPQHPCFPIFQFLSEILIINHDRHKSCKFKGRYLTLFIFPSFVRNIKWEMKATPSYLSDPSKAMQEAHPSLTINNQNKTEMEQHRGALLAHSQSTVVWGQHWRQLPPPHIWPHSPAPPPTTTGILCAPNRRQHFMRTQSLLSVYSEHSNLVGGLPPLTALSPRCFCNRKFLVITVFSSDKLNFQLNAIWMEKKK